MLTNFRAYLSRLTPIDDQEWALIKSSVKVQKLTKRQSFVSEGEVCRRVGFLLKGSMRYFYNHDGKELTTFFFFEKAFVGVYQSFLSQKPSQANIEALEECELATFDYDTLQSVYRNYPKMQMLGRLIAEQLFIGTDERLTSLLLETAEERYRKLLHEQQRIVTRIPQHYIASYLGITPVSLSRIRKRMLRDHTEG